jgi:hypothetical protein
MRLNAENLTFSRMLYITGVVVLAKLARTSDKVIVFAALLRRLLRYLQSIAIGVQACVIGFEVVLAAKFPFSKRPRPRPVTSF